MKHQCGQTDVLDELDQRLGDRRPDDTCSHAEVAENDNAEHRQNQCQDFQFRPLFSSTSTARIQSICPSVSVSREPGCSLTVVMDSTPPCGASVVRSPRPAAAGAATRSARELVNCALATAGLSVAYSASERISGAVIRVRLAAFRHLIPPSLPLRNPNPIINHTPQAVDPRLATADTSDTTSWISVPRANRGDGPRRNAYLDRVLLDCSL